MTPSRQQHALTARASWIGGSAIAVIACFCILILISSRDLFFQPTDLGIWLDDIHRLRVCLSESSSNPCLAISKFPLGYLANSIALQPLRAENGDPRAAMQVIQAAVLCLPVVGLIAINKHLRAGLGISTLYVLLLLLTPLPSFYVGSGALEIQAGVFLGLGLAFGQAALRSRVQRWKWLSNGCLLLGCFYKDTLALSFMMAAILALALTWSRRPSLLAVLSTWGPGIVGAGILSISWNLVRYHSLLPLGYLEEATLNRPSISQSLMSLWALYLSPNGGLVAFWGTALGVLLLLALIRRGWRSARLSFNSALPLTFMLIGVSSMALWWAPFGWVAWGARLSVPFVLAAMIAAVGQLSDPVEAQHQAKGDGFPGRRVKASLVGLIAMILISKSAPYVTLGYTHTPYDFFPEQREERVTSAREERPTEKSCTEQIFEEMSMQRPAHPNSGVRMWRTNAYWRCIEAGMKADPTRP